MSGEQASSDAVPEPPSAEIMPSTPTRSQQALPRVNVPVTPSRRPARPAAGPSPTGLAPDDEDEILREEQLLATPGSNTGDSHLQHSIGSTYVRGSYRPGYLGPRNVSDHPELNFPDRYESYYREPGEPAVTWDIDTRVPNCKIFHFHKEDHTLGNLLKYQLLKNKAVIFSGYRVPHPLFAEFDLRIQTDGSVDPNGALKIACEQVIGDLGTLSRRFTREVELHKVQTIPTDGV